VHALPFCVALENSTNSPYRTLSGTNSVSCLFFCIVLPIVGNMVIYPIVLRFVMLVLQFTLEKPEFLATLKAHKSKSNRINYRVRRGTVRV